MLERRASSAGGIAQAVEIGPQRIGYLVCARRIAEHDPRKGIKRRAVRGDEMIPGVGVAVAASDGEREVGGMKRVEKLFGLCAVDAGRVGAEPTREAFPQSAGEGRARDSPCGGVAGGLQTIDRVAVSFRELFQRHCRHAFHTEPASC
jgi:hypothetical protein